MTRRLAAVLCGVLRLCAPFASAGETVEVLNADSFFRLRLGWKTPVIVTASGRRKPLLEPKRRGLKDEDRKPAEVVRSAPLPDGWTQVDFDDRPWARDLLPVRFDAAFRQTEHVPGSPAEWCAIAARGKFLVRDLAKAGDLKLSLAYAGGAIVYLNGRELARAHVPAGEVRFDTLAEPYPPEAYVGPDGRKLPLPRDEKTRQLYAARYARRVRRLVDVPVPAERLRRGTNVLAVEVHRAALHEIWLTAPYGKVDWHGEWGPFGHAGLLDLKLTARAGSAVVPNVSRPPGVQVWTCPAHENLLGWHYGEASDRPAIRLVGARGGEFSGRVVIGSTAAIRRAKVGVSDLAAPGGAAIPPSAVRVRYAARTGPKRSWIPSRAESGAARFDMLLDAPPAEVAATEPPRPRRPVGWWSHPHAQPAPGAVLPVWVTVRVPADAPAGEYRAAVTVEAAGLEPTRVPLGLRVYAWRVPGSRRLVSHNNLYQSHESTALYYGVPLWSDRHFEMMGKVLELTAGAANRFCVVHLVCGAYHMGNSESMVRWIDRGGGKYEHDFTVFDRYLDLYESKCGKPGLLLLSVFVPGADPDRKTGKIRSPCRVSRLVPATGKVEPMDQPTYGTAASVAFWKPVLDGVRKRLARRGWLDVTALGTGSDRRPQPKTIAAFRKIWPDAIWMSSSHMCPSWYEAGPDERVDVYYRESVWGTGRLYDPDARPRRPHPSYPRPWKTDSPLRRWAFPRVGQEFCKALYDSSRLVLFRYAPEGSLQGGLTGIGRVGADFLPLPDPARPGRYRSLCGRVGAHLGPTASTRAFVAPGPSGPVDTERLAMFREGVQIREALVFLQQALDAGKLPDALAARCKKLLDDRARAYIRTRANTTAHWLAFESGAEQRDEALFALCAEVAAHAPAR